MSVLRPDVAIAALTDAVRFVVLDTETTPSDDGDRVVSVGFIQVDGRGQTLSPGVEWLCDPGTPVQNTRYHGLTDADVAGQPALSSRMDALDRVLRPRRRSERVVLVVHNAKFDIGVLKLEYSRAGRTLPNVAVLDTLQLARHFRVGAGSYKLPQLLAHYGLSITNHHHALADATDTAGLLRRLLDHAARAGHTDLTALLAAAQAERVSTATVDAAPAARTTRGRAGSPFLFIERPTNHQATHKKLPKDADAEALGQWLAGLRECVTLRCPLLADRVARLSTGRAEVLEALLEDLRGHVKAGRNVDANATLGALTLVAKRHLTFKTAAAFHDEHLPLLSGTTRCTAATTRPFDACPDCRAGLACPADSWPHSIAVALTGAQRNLNWKNAKPWFGPNGRLVQQVRERRPAVAAHAAWLVVSLLAGAVPDDAEALAELAGSLALVEPRLAHRQAQQRAADGDIAQALAGADTALAQQEGSTDPAWTELRAYRDALAAKLAAAARPRVVRPHRVGHSAPVTRPQRRRFTA